MSAENGIINTFLRRFSAGFFILHLLLSFVLLFPSQSAFSQANATEAAYRFFVLGDLENAQKEISKAVNDNFFKARAEPWFVKSLIYTEKFEQQLHLRFGRPEITDIELSWKALQNTVERDRIKVFQFRINVQTEKCMRMIHEYAQKIFQDDKYPEALRAYRVYAEMYNYLSEQKYRHVPVQGLVYYGRLLQREGFRNEALEYYEKLISQNTGDSEIYLAVSQLYKIENNYEKAFDFVRKGRGIAPQDYDLLAEALNLAPFVDKTQVLMEDLTRDANRFPRDAKIQFITANLLASVNQDIVKAEQYYLRAIEIDAEYYDAIFNLAVLYYNEAVAINEKLIGNRGPAPDINVLQEKRNDYYLKALPFFEKAAVLRPGDTSLQQIISNIRKLVPNTSNQ